MKWLLMLPASLLLSMARGADVPKAVSSAAPRWKFLGDDDGLLQTIQESDAVVLACVYRLEFLHLRPHFADAHLFVTVVDVYKSALKINDRIEIDFPIELSAKPDDPAAIEKELTALREHDLGNLRFCFLQRPQLPETSYSCEWVDVPKYTREMKEFLEAHRVSAK